MVEVAASALPQTVSARTHMLGMVVIITFVSGSLLFVYKISHLFIFACWCFLLSTALASALHVSRSGLAQDCCAGSCSCPRPCPCSSFCSGCSYPLERALALALTLPLSVPPHLPSRSCGIWVTGTMRSGSRQLSYSLLLCPNALLCYSPLLQMLCSAILLCCLAVTSHTFWPYFYCLASPVSSF
jgi:hypothetical protein